ncbi:MAG: hypothetical protein AAGD38_05830 [Acidobacteriota bacterium]
MTLDLFMLDPAVALDLCRRLVAAAVALSGLETLSLFRALRPGGSLARPSLRRHLLLATSALRFVVGVGLATALIAPSWHLPALVFLLAATWWSHASLAYGNSGADPMIGVVLTALIVGELVPDSELVQKMVVVTIAGHATIAYFTTGLTKALDARWRSGVYLHTTANSRIFGRSGSLLTDPRHAAVASWIVIIFELIFPIALLDPRAAVALCVAGLLFHLGNALILGLKNFLFAFAATYPAIIATAGLVSWWIGI